jgi:hypothetical protein
MGIVNRTLKFKDEHLSHYWVRVLCFAFSIVFLALWVTGDVDADTPADDEQEIQSDSQWPADAEAGMAADFVRQMNGTLWVFSIWENNEDANNRVLYGYYSTDNGSTWSTIVVTDDTDPGYDTDGFPRALFNTVVLSNNSIIICLQDMDYWGTSGKYEITFLCHWNNSDLSQWERVQGYYVSSKYALYGGMNVNETDKIVFSYNPYSSSHIQIKSFDPATRNVDTHGAILNKVPAGEFETTHVFWNGTEWNILLRYLTNLYCYDIDANQEWYFSVAVDREITDIVLSASGTYGISVNRQQVSSHYWYAEIWWRNATGDVTHHNILDAGQHGSGRLGLNNLNDNYFTFMTYDYVEDKFYWFGAEYWRGAAHWQTTKTECFAEDFDSPSDDHYDWPVELPNALYPIDPETGNHTQIPAGLGGPTWCFMEYDSATTSIDLWVDYETTWPGILWWTYVPFVPEDPDPDPDPGGDGDGIGEICSSNWLILLVMLVMLIGIVGMAAQIGN